VVIRSSYAGQAAAVLTGIAHARGPVLVTLDDDLQHRPEDIPRLLHHLAAADERTLVVAVAIAARGPWWRSMARTIANGISNVLLAKPIPMRLSAFCAFHKSLGEALTRIGSHRIAWVATLVQAAERTLRVPVQVDGSAVPRSRYRFRSLWTLFRNRTRLFVLRRILAVFVVAALLDVAATWANVRFGGGVVSIALFALATTTSVIAVMAMALAFLTLAERRGSRAAEDALLRASVVDGKKSTSEGCSGHSSKGGSS
jgi:glycosyltransferase involved in cell wall biosynthesis